MAGSWRPTAAARQTPRAAPHRGFQCLSKDTATLEYVMALSAGPGAADPDRYAAKVLATILGDDSGSRFYWALVDSGLAENATLGHHDYQGTGIFMTYMSCAPECAQENLARIAEIYETQLTDDTEAIRRYKDVLALDPLNPEALRGLDRVYSKLSRYQDLLENLKLQPLPEEAATYLARAGDGLRRLDLILTRMGEATRLEQLVRQGERERFDAREVVRGCVAGYQALFKGKTFHEETPGAPVWLSGSPDLFAQMLDKLAANAVDFSTDPVIGVRLFAKGGEAVLAVSNTGPRLPEAMQVDMLVGARQRLGVDPLGQVEDYLKSQKGGPNLEYKRTDVTENA